MDNVSDLPEFDHHSLVNFISDEKTGLRGFIAIHRGGTADRPALGATRLWKYDTEQEALRDALRLSRLMSYKSAIAGFKYGGAKAVLMFPDGAVKNRKAFFEAYAEKVNLMKGGFITGTDVGVTDEDIHIMKEKTPFVIGSKLDPAHYTAIGVVEGIKVCLWHVFGSEDVKGRTFAIQGLGKVGSSVLRILYDEADRIYVCDIDKEKVAAVSAEFPKVTVIAPKDLHKTTVDVLVPCALSGVLNERSVGELQCKIVAGSANNQLATKKAGTLLYDRNILYAPDYIINIGGFIGVVDEFEHGTPEEERILKSIGNMEKVLGKVFTRAAEEGKSPDAVADQIAERVMKKQPL